MAGARRVVRRAGSDRRDKRRVPPLGGRLRGLESWRFKTRLRSIESPDPSPASHRPTTERSTVWIGSGGSTDKSASWDQLPAHHQGGRSTPRHHEVGGAVQASLLLLLLPPPPAALRVLRALRVSHPRFEASSPQAQAQHEQVHHRERSRGHGARQGGPAAAPHHLCAPLRVLRAFVVQTPSSKRRVPRPERSPPPARRRQRADPRHDRRSAAALGLCGRPAPQSGLLCCASPRSPP